MRLPVRAAALLAGLSIGHAVLAAPLDANGRANLEEARAAGATRFDALDTERVGTLTPEPAAPVPSAPEKVAAAGRQPASASLERSMRLRSLGSR